MNVVQEILKTEPLSSLFHHSTFIIEPEIDKAYRASNVTDFAGIYSYQKKIEWNQSYPYNR